MDGATVEHSDSDSGESWTLLENNPTYGDDDVPETPENAIHLDDRINAVHIDKDEDTDGISIISDSEPESTPCDVNCIKESTQEPSPTENSESPLLVTPPTININNNTESVSEETDFLGDNVKYKTYVHKRNPRVGTILDIIMLGTFVITAGMALGHLWSCKNECTTQTSVNKILSNLYKLQEENAYLRSKLKEITEATSHQLEYRKTLNNKLANKRQRCKKIFEEPDIKNNNMGVAVKCVDDNKSDVILHDPLPMPEYEKEFLDDVDKMKKIYDQNKAWLDVEVEKQFEKSKSFTPDINSLENMGKQLGPILIPQNSEQLPKVPDITVKSHRQINLEKQIGPTYFEIPLTTKPVTGETKQTKTVPSDAVKSHRFENLELQLGSHEGINPSNRNDQSLPFESLSEKKITYADSLKNVQSLHKNKKNENNDAPNDWIKDHSGKRKRRDDDVLLDLNSSEENIRKDDRYTGPKIKHEKKKHDRQKSQKRQKRNNKYEQWEMKGGYLKDFDEFSVTSSQDNEMPTNNPEKMFLNPNFENYISKFIEIENNISNKDLPDIRKKTDEVSNKPQKHSLKGDRKKRKTKDSNWYDKRSALRAEARMKLEHELFGENTSNNAAWYFRRMQKREQCRTQKDNSTFKKFSKRKMNFKMKR